MPPQTFLRHRWPEITIAVTAAAIGCAAFVLLSNMPPHRIVMAVGPEGGAYYEDGSLAAGPPPRGLFEHRYKIENGALAILAGRLPTLSEPA